MGENAQIIDAPAQATKHNRISYAVVAATLIVVAFIFVYRLDVYPSPWHDESVYLKVAKNYALHGIYANFSSDGPRYGGPVVSVGPTLILPIALMFRFFGVSIVAARIVAVGYGLLTLGGLYLLGSLVNRRLALITVVLVAFSPALDMQYYSRNALGEIPGLFFIVIGLWLWLRSPKPKLLVLIGVGIFLGLACITKGQYAMFILPSLLLALIADLVWYRQKGWLYFVIPGAISTILFLLWTYYILFLLGAESRNVAEDLETLRVTGANGFFLLRPDIILGNLRFLLQREVHGGLLVPVMLYGLVLSLRRNNEGQWCGIIFIFVTTSALLFLTSIGWPRWAVAPLTLAAFFVAYLFYTLTDGFRFDLYTLRAIINGKELQLSEVTRILVIGLIFGTTILPIYGRVDIALNYGGDEAYRAAEYVETNLPPDALIETWEEELAVLTDYSYHFPPQVIEAYVVSEEWLQGSPASERYHFEEYVTPDYVIAGPFSKWAGIYTPEQLEDYVLVDTIGQYDIYERNGD
jgi:hypothetical protein